MTDDLDVLWLAQKLIGFKTINPPGQEGLCIAFLANILRERGLDVETIRFEEGRTNLVARLAATTESELLPLVFSGHVDTVPLGYGKWSIPPFDGVIRNGRLYGRGASDMKSGVAAFVVAAAQMAQQLVRRADIMLIISAGEETGSEGVHHLVHDESVKGDFGALIVAEPTDARPLLGHKGALWLSMTTQGVTAHSSMPSEGINAVAKAARLVDRLSTFDFGIKSHPVMGDPTINVSTIRGGININSVPDESVIGVDIRTVVGQSVDGTLQSLRSFVGDDVDIEPIVSMDCVFTDWNKPFVQTVFSVVQDMTEAAPTLATAAYFTDASVLTPAFGSPATVIMGPGTMSMAHQTDEYCEIDNLGFCLEAYTRIAKNYVY